MHFGFLNSSRLTTLFLDDVYSDIPNHPHFPNLQHRAIRSHESSDWRPSSLASALLKTATTNLRTLTCIITRWETPHLLLEGGSLFPQLTHLTVRLGSLTITPTTPIPFFLQTTNLRNLNIEARDPQNYLPHLPHTVSSITVQAKIYPNELQIHSLKTIDDLLDSSIHLPQLRQIEINDPHLTKKGLTQGASGWQEKGDQRRFLLKVSRELTSIALSAQDLVDRWESDQ